MSDNQVIKCKCGFTGLEMVFGKTEGYCPVCKEGRKDLVEKYKNTNYSKRV